jgi:hypothetical protein
MYTNIYIYIYTYIHTLKLTPEKKSGNAAASNSTKPTTYELQQRLAYLKKHNQSLENEHQQLLAFKQQVDHEIERVIQTNNSYCYLTLDDIARFEIIMAAQQEALVVVNAPYDTDIEVHQQTNDTPYSPPKVNYYYATPYMTNAILVHKVLYSRT